MLVTLMNWSKWERGCSDYGPFRTVEDISDPRNTRNSINSFETRLSLLGPVGLGLLQFWPLPGMSKKSQNPGNQEIQ